MEESSERHDALEATEDGRMSKASVLSYQAGWEAVSYLRKHVFNPKYGDFIAVNIFGGIMANSYAFLGNP